MKKRAASRWDAARQDSSLAFFPLTPTLSHPSTFLRVAPSRSTMPFESLRALSPSPLDHARGDPECVEGSKGMAEGPQAERPACAASFGGGERGKRACCKKKRGDPKDAALKASTLKPASAGKPQTSSLKPALHYLRLLATASCPGVVRRTKPEVPARRDEVYPPVAGRVPQSSLCVLGVLCG